MKYNAGGGGSAQRWLDRKRKEKVEMKIRLDVKMVRLLNGMLRRDDDFLVAMQLCTPPLRPYAASDGPGARQLIALQRWLEEKVFEKEGDARFRFVDREVSLKQVYVDRLLHMLDHFKALGMMAQLAEPYMMLKDALEGREFVVDDPSEGDE